MSKFNRAVKNPSVKPKVVNVAGGEAFEDNARMALYKQVATSLWNGDQYYEKHADWRARFRANVAQVVKEGGFEWALKLACYARDKRGLKLRTTPIALLAELSRQPQGDLIRKYTPKIVLRGDEPAEALSYLSQFWTVRKSGSTHTKKTWPHGLVKGLQTVLPKLDEHQLAKYKGEGNALKLRDVFRIVRPTPADEAQRALWGRAVKGELAVPYTWEVQLSASADKKATWNELIVSGKLGVFALLRNLRNIQEAGADLDAALAQFNEKRVRESGILPFQWYKGILNTDLKAKIRLEECLEWSLSGLERWPGTTVVVVDHSGSMSGSSQTRGLTMAHIADLMGALAVKVAENARVIAFADNAVWVSGLKPQMSVNWNANLLAQTMVGGSTYAYKIFDVLNVEPADRILLFSDMQSYREPVYEFSPSKPKTLSERWREYRRRYPKCRLYSIDLNSQDNTSQFDEKDGVIELAGWSEQIFSFVSAVERDASILDWIEKTY